MMRQRQDPYEEKQGKTGIAVWVLRLAVLFIAVTAVVTAVLVLFDAFSGIRGFSGSSAGSPDLNPIERLYLENYLSSRTEELAEPIGQGTEAAVFVIESGQGAKQVADNLASAGLLFDQELFLNYIRYQGVDSQLVAGSFRLNPQLTIPELAVALTQTQILEVEINFLNGWRLEEMANYLATIQPAEIDAQEFLALARRSQLMSLDEYAFLNSLPPEATLEGFLFPGTYRISTETDAPTLIRLMLSRFDEQVDPSLRQLFGARQLSVFEAVTLASIVQREAVDVAEQPLIAGVFLNRLQLGMLLQADATVQYAIGNEDLWWKSPLSANDLTADSPYNTYIYPDLPPGPIANPGLSALQAAAAPEESDYLYFVADCSPGAGGQHLFSATYEEHLVNVARCSGG
ncbi:MAG: endolytic transglycosylase MltG [Candidatus Promineifilaceae bacterium]